MAVRGENLADGRAELAAPAVVIVPMVVVTVPAVRPMSLIVVLVGSAVVVRVGGRFVGHVSSSAVVRRSTRCRGAVLSIRLCWRGGRERQVQSARR